MWRMGELLGTRYVSLAEDEPIPTDLDVFDHKYEGIGDLGDEECKIMVIRNLGEYTLG